MSVAASAVAASLNELALIGRTADGGVTRVAWSPEIFAAYDWMAERFRDLGLDVEIDPGGNLVGRWTASQGQAAVVVGSHLDTVPSGGRFDGVLGVVAALHAVAQLKEEGYEPARPLWIAAFMDEEGTRFDTALFGSRALVGDDLSALGSRADSAGTTLREAMAATGYDFDRVPLACRIADIATYLELHIEQGPVLESEGQRLGVVTSIVGVRSYRASFRGEPNHAGTTPMHLRRDALAGAAGVVLALREEVRGTKDATANVGKIRVDPGGSNVIPGTAEFSIDVRATTSAKLAQLDRRVEKIVKRIAAEESLVPQLELMFALEPLELDPTLIEVLERAAASEGVLAKRMPSGAGHDAMVVGRHVPAAMLFVPSRRGISHAPDEDSRPEDVELGVRVLTAALRELLRGD